MRERRIPLQPVVMIEVDDAELLRRYADDSVEEAFAELVSRYIGIVYHAALRQAGGDAHRAEDITQTVFCLLARKARQLRSHPSIAGWLHTTTRYSALRLMRAEQRRVAREQEALTMDEISRGEPATDWERLRPVIDDVLGELNERDREAVLLRFFAELSFPEIGARLALSENTARMRVERALEKLRLRLARRGLTSTAAALGSMLGGHIASGAPAGLAASVTNSALTQAAFAAGGASAAMGFMAGFKTTVAMAAAGVLIVALGSAWYGTHTRRLAEQELARANAEMVAATSRLHQIEKQAAEMAQGVERLRREEAAKASADRAAAAPGSPLTGASTEWNPAEEGQKLLARHPELKPLLREHVRATVMGEFAGLFAELNLAPEQIELFVRNRAAPQSYGFGVGPGGKTLVVPAKDVFEEGVPALPLKDLLGDDGFARFERYMRARVVRQVLFYIGDQLTFSDRPLTIDQAERLREVLGSVVVKRAPSARTEIDWDTVTSRMENILAPAQREVLVANIANARRQAEIDRSFAARKQSP